MRIGRWLCCFFFMASFLKGSAQLLPVNDQEISTGDKRVAITNIRIIDGTGVVPIESGTVLVSGTKILAVGEADEVSIPEDAEILDGTGMTVLPGLFDAHFHLNNTIVNSYLTQGITTIRDPGAWMESYHNIRASGQMIPRLFLTGPHFDMYPPSYPKNSVIIRDRQEADLSVKRFVAAGATAIKIYFRCTPEIIQQACQTAREFGIPVTGHLEITDIYQAIRMGLNGIEHITSLGSSLVPKPQAEAYRQEILADNNARRQGRYRMWATIDPYAQPSTDLAAFLAEQRTFVCPTLGAFEYQDPGENLDTNKLQGFAEMLRYTKVLNDAGVNLVLGSHTYSPYDKLDGAYHHEMELWARAGISPMDILVAATYRNARFFRVEDRLGSLAPGMIADLVVVDGNPLEDIGIMRNVRKVMLNGIWVE